MVRRLCFFLGHYSPSMHVILEYYEKILPEDIELFFVCANKVDKEKYKFKRIKLSEFLDSKWKVIVKLRRFLKENRIDALVAFGGQFEVSITLVAATLFTNTKGVFYCLVNPKVNLKNSVFLLTQFFTNCSLFCCKEVGDKFKRFLFFGRKSIFYLPCPINVNIFKPENKERARKMIGLSAKDKVIIYVGRIEIEQGSDFLLKLIENNLDKKFLLIGEVRDENFKNREFENVRFVPHVPNKELPQYYSAADLSVFLSKRNSYPYPPREALACGVFVIAFDLDTFGQLNTPAVKKVPFELARIQEEIDNFFLLPEKEKKRLADEGRKFVVADSSEEKVKEIALRHFARILNGNCLGS